MVHGPYNFMLPSDPECPHCRMVLIPEAVAFVRGTAFCRSCYDTIPDNRLTHILASQHPNGVPEAWTTTRGMTFFSPPKFYPKRIAAHLLRSFMSTPRGHIPESAST